MKHFFLTYIYVFVTGLMSLNAQIAKQAFAEPIQNTGPQTINSQEPTFSPRSRRLVSPEEVSQCLFNHIEIRSAYSEFLGLREFYSAHQASDLWKNSLKTIFSDRQSSDTRSKCVNILKLFPNNELPSAPPKFSYHKAIKETMGEDLQNEFSFCLSYIGLEYLDKELWDAYISREKELINSVKALPVSSIRLKALILATDFQTKVCELQPGLIQNLK